MVLVANDIASLTEKLKVSSYWFPWASVILMLCWVENGLASSLSQVFYWKMILGWFCYLPSFGHVILQTWSSQTMIATLYIHVSFISSCLCTHCIICVCVHIYIMCVYMHVCNIHVCVQCSPWAKRSCCTEETAQGIGFDRTWLNFDWHHCGALSPECTQHFIKDLCFYECSPNVGPYLQPVSVSWSWLVFCLHFQLLPVPVHSQNAVKKKKCQVHLILILSPLQGLELKSAR